VKEEDAEFFFKFPCFFCKIQNSKREGESVIFLGFLQS